MGGTGVKDPKSQDKGAGAPYIYRFVYMGGFFLLKLARDFNFMLGCHAMVSHSYQSNNKRTLFQPFSAT